MGFLRRIIGSAKPQPARPEPTVACPHCGVILDPIPPRQRLCPACRQPIIPRSRADGARLVLREEDLPAFEAWNEAWYAARERESWIAKARAFVDEAGFVAIESELAAKQAGHTPRYVYLVAADRAMLDMISRNDWGRLASAYYSLALEEYGESEQDHASKHVLSLLREANRARLRDYLANETRSVDIDACECSVCSRSPRGPFSIRDELKAPHIPHARCQERYCSCDYLPAVEE